MQITTYTAPHFPTLQSHPHNPHPSIYSSSSPSSTKARLSLSLTGVGGSTIVSGTATSLTRLFPSLTLPLPLEPLSPAPAVSAIVLSESNPHVGVGTSGAVVDASSGTASLNGCSVADLAGSPTEGAGEGIALDIVEEEGVPMLKELVIGIEEAEEPGTVDVGFGAAEASALVDDSVAGAGVGTGTGFRGTSVQPGGTTTPPKFC